MRSQKVFSAGLCLLLVALATAGCSKKEDKEPKPDSPGEQRIEPTAGTAEVNGTVKLADGKPLPAGWVAFHGKDASQTVLAPIDNGKFVARGVAVGGTIGVTIDVAAIDAAAARLDSQLQEALVRGGLMKDAGKGDAALTERVEEMKERRKKLSELQGALKGVKIARKYAQRETTPLSYKVAAGTQTIEIDLKP